MPSGCGEGCIPIFVLSRPFCVVVYLLVGTAVCILSRDCGYNFLYDVDGSMRHFIFLLLDHFLADFYSRNIRAVLMIIFMEYSFRLLKKDNKLYKYI